MLLNANYYGAHLYTLVPRHVADDLAWLADHGVDAISLAICEQDLSAARRNIHHVCAAAQRAGLKVFAVPSRWAGLMAGAPKVPSVFSATHPETWVQRADGTTHISRVSGVISSFHHPATREFCVTTVQALLREFPFAGVTWDEPKAVDVLDHSPRAVAALGGEVTFAANARALAAFFDELGAAARAVRPDVVLSLFLYAQLTDPAVLQAFSTIPHLDHFGCDGRPWRLADDRGWLEGTGKVLLPNAEAFLSAARAAGKGGCMLIENHALPAASLPVLDARLGETLDLNAEHTLFYYYPREVEDPDAQMAIIGQHLLAWRERRGGAGSQRSGR